MTTFRKVVTQEDIEAAHDALIQEIADEYELKDFPEFMELTKRLGHLRELNEKAAYARGMLKFSKDNQALQDSLIKIEYAKYDEVMAIEALVIKKEAEINGQR